MRLVFICLLTFAMAITNESATRPETGRERAEKTAQQFIARFQETLDFGAAFDLCRAADTAKALRHIRFLQIFHVAPDVATATPDAALLDYYKTLMNSYYIARLYQIIVSLPQGKEGAEAAMPSDVARALRESKFAAMNANPDGGREISTAAELAEYIALTQRLTRLYKRHLPHKPFASKPYLEFAAEQLSDKSIAELSGYADLGVAPSHKVWALTREMFTIYLVEEKGAARILAFALGN